MSETVLVPESLEEAKILAKEFGLSGNYECIAGKACGHSVGGRRRSLLVAKGARGFQVYKRRTVACARLLFGYVWSVSSVGCFGVVLFQRMSAKPVF